MGELKVIHRLDEAQAVWEALMPRDVVTDLWEVRFCFHRHYRRPLHFVVEETDGRPTGLLPLCWMQEQECYIFFPGEVWHGRTWLEQNVIVARNIHDLLKAVNGPYNIRYLSSRSMGLPQDAEVDETGYLFHPRIYGNEFDAYLKRFSGKSLKRIRSEIAAIESQGLSWRLNEIEDLNLMLDMNIGRFGGDSYFSDRRFREGFREMVHLFDERGWLRVTTALVGGKAAAVDIGVVYKGTYTLMAGGTSPSCPGIAKLINFQHMKSACAEEMTEVDFLCGDFNWKKMFHLQPRPLFVLSDTRVRAA